MPADLLSRIDAWLAAGNGREVVLTRDHFQAPRCQFVEPSGGEFGCFGEDMSHAVEGALKESERG